MMYGPVKGLLSVICVLAFIFPLYSCDTRATRYALIGGTFASTRSVFTNNMAILNMTSGEWLSLDYSRLKVLTSVRNDTHTYIGGNWSNEIEGRRTTTPLAYLLPSDGMVHPIGLSIGGGIKKLAYHRSTNKLWALSDYHMMIVPSVLNVLTLMDQGHGVDRNDLPLIDDGLVCSVEKNIFVDMDFSNDSVFSLVLQNGSITRIMMVDSEGKECTFLSHVICDGLTHVMAIWGDVLYIGGTFTHVSNTLEGCASPDLSVSSPKFAAFDITQKEWVGSSLTFGEDDYISAIHVNPGNVKSVENSGSGYILVAGNFADIAGVEGTYRLAKFDGQSWSMATSEPFPVVGGSLLTLNVDGDDIFIGGQFSYMDFNSIAYWDGKKWNNIDSGVFCRDQFACEEGKEAMVKTITILNSYERKPKDDLLRTLLMSLFDIDSRQLIIIAVILVLALTLAIMTGVCFKITICCRKCFMNHKPIHKIDTMI